MPILRFTDGTTTLDLADGDNTALEEGGWAPQTPHLNRAALGGASPYADVQEEIAANIFAFSPDDTGLNERLQTMNALIMQAEQWAEGAYSVPAVRMQYQPDNSALPTPLECAVLGNPGAGAVGLPNSYHDYSFLNEVEGAGVRFRRRGALLGAEDTTADGVTTTTPVIALAFDEAVPYPSPTWVELDPLPLGAAIYTSPGLIVASDAPDGVVFLHQSAFTKSGAGSVISDTSNRAWQDTIWRVTGSTFESVMQANVTLSGSNLVVAVLLRNTSLSAATIRLEYATNGPGIMPNTFQQSDILTIPALTDTASPPGGGGGGAPSAQYLLFDPVFIAPRFGPDSVAAVLRIVVDPGTADDQIDINGVLLINADRAYVVRHPALAHINAPDTSLRLRIDPRPLEQPSGDVRAQVLASFPVYPTPAVAARIGAFGNPNIYTSGGALYVAHLCPQGTRWRIQNAAGTAGQPCTARAGRRRAYLIPE